MVCPITQGDHNNLGVPVIMTHRVDPAYYQRPSGVVCWYVCQDHEPSPNG